MAEEPQAPVQRKEFEVIDAAFDGAVAGYVWVFGFYILAATALITGGVTDVVVSKLLQIILPMFYAALIAECAGFYVAWHSAGWLLRKIRRH